jgi:hypothetical protein
MVLAMGTTVQIFHCIMLSPIVMLHILYKKNIKLHIKLHFTIKPYFGKIAPITFVRAKTVILFLISGSECRHLVQVTNAVIPLNHEVFIGKVVHIASVYYSTDADGFLCSKADKIGFYLGTFRFL